MLIRLSNNVVINPDNIIIIPAGQHACSILTADMHKITTVPWDECQKILHLASTPGPVLRTDEWCVVEEQLHRRHAMCLANKYLGRHQDGTPNSDFGSMLDSLKADIARTTKEEFQEGSRIQILQDVAGLRSDPEFDRFTTHGREILGDILSVLEGLFSSKAKSQREMAKCILKRWDDIFEDLPS